MSNQTQDNAALRVERVSNARAEAKRRYREMQRIQNRPESFSELVVSYVSTAQALLSRALDTKEVTLAEYKRLDETLTQARLASHVLAMRQVNANAQSMD